MVMKIMEDEMDSQSLLGNYLNDPWKRKIRIIEHNVNDDTPILIGLAGFFGTSISFLNRSFTSIDFMGVLQKLINSDRLDSFIIVLPDTMTAIGGNQYLNSSAVGNYEDFIVKDLLSYLTVKYGVRKTGLFGKSSGGFGSYTLTVNHPDKFQGFIDVSGDCGFEYCYMKDFPETINDLRKTGISETIRLFRGKDYHDQRELNTMNMIAMAAFYSPDIDEESRISMPFNIKTGQFKDKVWQKWKKFDPMVNVYDHLEDLDKIKIILQTGKRDEFSLNLGMEGLSLILQENSVRHSFSTYDGGHFGIDYLYLDSIPELIEYLKEL